MIDMQARSIFPPRGLGRRDLLLAGIGAACATPSAAALPVPDAGVLSFRVLRNDSPIGSHVLTFAPAGNALTVRVAVALKVGIGPITLYRYSHQAEERWRDGVVVSVDAETNDDGTIGRTVIRREAGGYSVEGRGVPRYLAPPEALPATHWNRRMLDGPMINTQMAELMRPVVTRVGAMRVALRDGAAEADHFTLRGDADLDTWYDARPSWVALRFVARDGSVIRYERS
jgi:hypothetical protein